MAMVIRDQMAKRRAMILVAVLVAIGVVGVLLAHDLRETISVRRQVHRHEQMVQTRLLAACVAGELLENGPAIVENGRLDFSEDFPEYLTAQVELTVNPNDGYNVTAVMARSVLITSQTKHTVQVSSLALIDSQADRDQSADQDEDGP